mmetsp:Transcript_32694/g.75275  ORF Transcript_32694/g.75275 Transcript_32694/m.75275 type:complete len:254 (+) Transcript_32694:333-1094(+)
MILFFEFLGGWRVVFCTMFHQILRYGMVFSKVMRCVVQDTSPTICHSVQVRSTFMQVLDDLQMSTTRRLVDWEPAVVVRHMQRILVFLSHFLEHFQLSILCHHVRGGRSGSPPIVLPSLLFHRVKTIQPTLHNVLCLRGALNHIWWQVILIEFTLGKIFCSVMTYLFVWLLTVVVFGGLKMNKYIGNKLSLEWEGSTMQNGVTFVQDHVSRFHRDVMCLAIMSNHFQRPWFFEIGIDIDNGRTYQGKSIDVGR